MTRNLAEKDFGQFDLSMIDVKILDGWIQSAIFALIGCYITHSPQNEFLSDSRQQGSFNRANKHN